jgi:hypothetical protein
MHAWLSASKNASGVTLGEREDTRYRGNDLPTDLSNALRQHFHFTAGVWIRDSPVNVCKIGLRVNCVFLKHRLFTCYAKGRYVAVLIHEFIHGCSSLLSLKLGRKMGAKPRLFGRKSGNVW